MKAICALERPRAIAGLIIGIIGSVLLVSGAAHAWNFTVPAVQVKPVNGAFSFPAAEFQDGTARHFEYAHAPNQRVRFFIVKSTDGVIRAALDACDRCFQAKKGYVQQGTNMICINCGLKFRTDKINVLTGGCNPHPLKVTNDGKNLIITQQDVVAGLRYFQ